MIEMWAKTLFESQSLTGSYNCYNSTLFKALCGAGLKCLNRAITKKIHKMDLDLISYYKNAYFIGFYKSSNNFNFQAISGF